jgi:hypothetical protein
MALAVLWKITCSTHVYCCSSFNRLWLGSVLQPHAHAIMFLHISFIALLNIWNGFGGTVTTLAETTDLIVDQIPQ